MGGALSLALRLVGDFTGHWRARPWGGLLNAASIFLFLVITAAALVLTPRSRRQ